MIRICGTRRVYENWVAANKAVIHGGSCRFCNEGSGTGRNIRGDRNGKWHGPFATVAGAEAAARSTGRPVRSCRCTPSTGSAHNLPKPAGTSQPPAAVAVATAGGVQQLAEIGFERAGAWRLDPKAKGGVRCDLFAFRADRVVYAFVDDEAVAYIGICDSSSTTMADRMSRYQNVVGGGTNERIVGLIRKALSADHAVEIFALKPAPGPQHLSLNVDFIKGLEFPLIERLSPLWNKRR